MLQELIFARFILTNSNRKAQIKKEKTLSITLMAFCLRKLSFHNHGIFSKWFQVFIQEFKFLLAIKINIIALCRKRWNWPKPVLTMVYFRIFFIITFHPPKTVTNKVEILMVCVKKKWCNPKIDLEPTYM